MFLSETTERNHKKLGMVALLQAEIWNFTVSFAERNINSQNDRYAFKAKFIFLIALQP